MKFPKLNLVVAHDELGPQMQCVQVGKEFTFASDAHILVRHLTAEIFKPDFVESLPKEPILIPGKAFHLVCQKATVKVTLSDDKKLFQLHRLDESVISYKLFTDGNYPDANSIIPDPSKCKPLDEIGINSALLDRLSDGLGCDNPILHLRFFDKTQAIYVTSSHTDHESAVGVIMPVYINQQW